MITFSGFEISLYFLLLYRNLSPRKRKPTQVLTRCALLADVMTFYAIQRGSLI